MFGVCRACARLASTAGELVGKQVNALQPYQEIRTPLSRGGLQQMPVVVVVVVVVVVSSEKDYQSVLWESAGFMQVKVGA